MDGLLESDLVEDEAEASEESEDYDETVLLLVLKSKTKSAVWNYFRIKSDSNWQPCNLSNLNVKSLYQQLM